MSSCYNCTKSFSLLNRERACKKCGFAFCGNCLKHKMILPDPDGKMSEKSVCGSCHQRMSQPQASKRPPPDALIRRLESLETPPNPPITVYSKKMDRLKRGMSKEDAQIADRLEKLQSDRKTSQHELPTDHEMAKRLAKLKGEVADETISAATGSVLIPKPTKSDVEQTVDLLSKIVDEVKLDQKLPKPDDEIADRLARLRGQEPAKEGRREETNDVCPEEFLSKFPKITNSKGINANTPIDIQRLLEEVSEENESDARQAIEAFETDQDLQNQLNEWRQKKKDQPEKMEVDDDDDQEAARVVERVMAEAALEEDDDEDGLDDRIPAPPSKSLVRQIQRAIRLSESSDRDSDELPWCTICNEDASLRCHGCEGDLYCRRCFRECHTEDIDQRDHKVEEYKAPPTKPS